MIVRILGEGQFDVPAEAVDLLNERDTAVEAAVTAGDETTFTAALAALLDTVRSSGTATDPETLAESDVILPPADATLAEVREMLADDGLVPD